MKKEEEEERGCGDRHQGGDAVSTYRLQKRLQNST